MARYLRKYFQYKSHSLLLIYFLAPLVILFSLTIINEALDLPHLFLGDKPTSIVQRKGEILLEGIFFLATLSFLFLTRLKLVKKIRILEGIIPICTHCKKIKIGAEWKSPDEYISSRSMADFSHGICPDCLQKQYPEFASEILVKQKEAVKNENSKEIAD